MAAWIQQIVHHLYDVRGLVEWGGLLLICIMVFVETGLFVGFFLPGDSLLVTAGVFASTGALSLMWMLALVTLCAIAGDQLGYVIGRKAGRSLYSRPDSRFFKKRHLEEAHAFYEKHGPKTIIMARFVPVVRTFCPPVSGAAEMPYARYLMFDIVGGALWVGATVLTGYTLGKKIPNIESKLHWVIGGVILLSLTPVAYHALKARYGRNARAARTGFKNGEK
jgi:membrane-associated protein